MFLVPVLFLIFFYFPIIIYITNPILSVDYGRFPYYDEKKVGEHPWYSEKDRMALAKAFDEIGNPDAGDLAAGFCIETAGRNSEVRAVRFEDFHFEAITPYVRLCGMARKNHRDEEIKADSYAGKRNVPMTPRLERIFHLAKEISWSDTFPFVMDPQYVHGDEVLIPACRLERALKRLCKNAGVKYLPPHQIRFSDATIMASQGAGIDSVQRRLGHTGPTMAQHYIRQYNQCTLAAGPELSQSIPKENTPNS